MVDALRHVVIEEREVGCGQAIDEFAAFVGHGRGSDYQADGDASDRLLREERRQHHEENATQPAAADETPLLPSSPAPTKHRPRRAAASWPRSKYPAPRP